MCVFVVVVAVLSRQSLIINTPFHQPTKQYQQTVRDGPLSERTKVRAGAGFETEGNLVAQPFG